MSSVLRVLSTRAGGQRRGWQWLGPTSAALCLEAVRGLSRYSSTLRSSNEKFALTVLHPSPEVQQMSRLMQPTSAQPLAKKTATNLSLACAKSQRAQVSGKHSHNSAGANGLSSKV